MSTVSDEEWAKQFIQPCDDNIDKFDDIRASIEYSDIYEKYIDCRAFNDNQLLDFPDFDKCFIKNNLNDTKKLLIETGFYKLVDKRIKFFMNLIAYVKEYNDELKKIDEESSQKNDEMNDLYDDTEDDYDDTEPKSADTSDDENDDYIYDRPNIQITYSIQPVNIPKRNKPTKSANKKPNNGK